MSEIKHSPLPWAIIDRSGDGKVSFLGDKDDELVSQIDLDHNMNGDENEQFIVEACNNYYRLKEQNKKLLSALKNMTTLAEYGVNVCAENSRQEEREGHADGLRSMIDDAKEAIKSCHP